MHLDDLAGDAAKCETALDVLLDHLFPEIPRNGKGGAAGAHLHGEIVFEIAGSDYRVRRILGDEQLLRVLGEAGRAAHDAVGIAYVIDLYDVIHLAFGDAEGGVGEGNEVIGDYDALIGIERIELGIAQGAAAGAFLAVPVVAVGVAVGIAGGSAEERDVYMQLAGFDGRRPAAVGAEYDGEIHETVGDGVTQLAAEAAGLDMIHNAVLDVLDEGPMAVGKAACGKGEVLYAHLRDDVHHHVDDEIAVPEMMVEGDGHAVLEADALYRLLNGGEDLLGFLLTLVEAHEVLLVKVLFVIDAVAGGNFFYVGDGIEIKHIITYLSSERLRYPQRSSSWRAPPFQAGTAPLRQRACLSSCP